MYTEEIIVMAKSTVVIVFYLSMPTIAAATVVGLIVALVQTLIQLQEQTLGFAAKLAAVVAVFVLWGPWMATQLLMFLKQALSRVSGL
ncbi:type III secretion protein S [Bradyrhizobium sp. USDA 4524]|uniref:EscS/YscS/HrcS family type III secretion system export apparatus protein n=1 Tax=unclassified Bradyrhizobium TaxID=2631580 RepID=UPI00273A6EF3|nr:MULTISPECIES: flagellar biosynthetic protein FliQ [unclassified Bradyrhizobium]MCP1846087.1 type III secretion protein S [Bradyrhizobium sp. USDA 4538]MCP1907279.1 type III secretion protein S [Bradyrhizobium sp. USDA 4537]MCP1985754.1 type III secretion protein S [Bradyrhizobium sp. USDA 4539]